MTFEDIISFIFPSGPPEGKQFIIKSSLENNSKQYLPNQVLQDVFLENHANTIRPHRGFISIVFNLSPFLLM